MSIKITCFLTLSLLISSSYAKHDITILDDINLSKKSDKELRLYRNFNLKTKKITVKQLIDLSRGIPLRTAEGSENIHIFILNLDSVEQQDFLKSILKKKYFIFSRNINKRNLRIMNIYTANNIKTVYQRIVMFPYAIGILTEEYKNDFLIESLIIVEEK